MAHFEQSSSFFWSKVPMLPLPAPKEQDPERLDKIFHDNTY